MGIPIAVVPAGTVIRYLLRALLDAQEVIKRHEDSNRRWAEFCDGLRNHARKRG